MKEMIFENAAIDIRGGGVVIWKNAKRGYPRQQTLLNNGVIEYYDDGTISIYGHKISWDYDLSCGESWADEQDKIEKYCKFDVEEAEVFYSKWWKLWCFITRQKYIPIKYKRPKKPQARLKAYEDFRLDLIEGCNLSIYNGINPPENRFE